MKKFFLFSLLSAFYFFQISPLIAQIKPPGYEREMEQLKKERQGNMLDRDSVVLVEYITIADPDGGEDIRQKVSTKMSLRYYCIKWLGIQEPNRLLDGKPMKIVNPETYEEMKVKLNLQAHRIDTLKN